ncbi:MAG: AraC family transcriptional regulator ligand-binding domain-containing protein [Actinomycetota bacterium]
MTSAGIAVGPSMPTNDGWQRVGPLVEVSDVLRDFGVDPAEVLTEAGLAADVLDDSGNTITFLSLGRLLACCVKATRCLHFGLLVGQRARPDHFGLIGNLMENAPTLGAAIMDLANNQHRYVRGSVIEVLFRIDECIVCYSVYQSNVQAIDQIIDTAVCAGFRILTAISDVAPQKILLPQRKPVAPLVYREAFGLKPHFNSGIAALVYSRDLLQTPLPRADASLRRRLEATVAKYWAIEQPDFTSQVARVLRAKILSGHADKKAVAKALSVNPRVLSRRLLAAGTSLRALTSQARVEIACHLLSSTSMTVTEIAKTLHYADVTGLIRAFTKATGKSPTDWKKSLSDR